VVELIHIPNIISCHWIGRKISAEAGDQLCYPGENITNSKLDLKFKIIRKPTLFLGEEYWPHDTSLASKCLFGKIKYPETYYEKRGNHHSPPTVKSMQNNIVTHILKSCQTY
jgi:hypothetical protein